MDASVIRVVIVGCGAVTSELYVHSLKRLTRQGAIRVISLVDVDPARAATVQKSFPRALCYTALADALNATVHDLAIIASPPAYHCEQAVTALSRGLHVLCEKPMATTARDCAVMLKAAEDATRRLFIGLPRRMYPALYGIRELVNAGTLGKHLAFSYHEGGRFSWPIATIGGLRRASSGGGVLMDKGSHALDFLVQIFGAPQSLRYFDDALGNGVETNCLIGWEGSSESGEVTLSWDQEMSNRLRIEGDLGQLTWDIGDMAQVHIRLRGESPRAVQSPRAWPNRVGEPVAQVSPRNYFDCLFLQLVQVLRAIRASQPSPLDAATAAVAVGMIEQCYLSAAPLPQPWLPQREQAEAARQHWSRSQ